MQLTKLISRLFIATIILFFAISTYLQFYEEYKNFHNRSAEKQRQMVKQQKERTRHEVERVVHMINYERQRTESLLKKNIAGRVDEAYAIIQGLYAKYKDSLPEQQLKNLIKDALRPVRFSQGRSYYYIMDLDGYEVLNPAFPHLEGSYLLHSRDKQIASAVRNTLNYFNEGKHSDGFFESRWYKPNSGDSLKYSNHSYLRSFRPFRWLIGNSEYLSEVRQTIQNRLLDQLADYRYGKQGYIFINQFDGTPLILNGLRVKEDINLLTHSDSTVRKVFRKEVAAAQKPDGDFISYNWRKLDSDTLAAKTSFIYGIPEWKWIVGSGVYLDDIENGIKASQKNLFRKFRNDLLRNILILVLVLVLFAILRAWLVRRINDQFGNFTGFFKRAVAQDGLIPEAEIRYDELKKLSKAVNTILNERIEAARNLHKEKEYLAVTLNSINDGVIATDIAGKITSINTKARNMLSLSETAPLPNSLTELFPFLQTEFDKIKAQQEIVRTAADLQPEPYIASNGQKMFLEYSLAPLRDNTSQIIGAVLVFRDVSNRLKSEEANLKLRKLESVGVLAGGIAHDFNNLLAGIFGNISLAKHYINPKEKAYRYIDSAEQSIDRATSLTKQLLTFAKGGDPVKESVKMGDFIREVVDFNLRGSNVRAEYQIDDHLFPARIDKGQFSQVIANLVINGRQAMPDGGILNVELHNYWHKKRALPDPIPQLELIIEDFGCGIPEKYLAKVFDPYFTTKQQGSGLGLSMVYSIIKKHEGFIDVSSRPNQGTKFKIYIPAEETEDAAGPVKKTPAPSESGTNHGYVLLVDDEPEILQIGSAMLKSFGLEVETRTDGKSAIESYRKAMEAQRPYDVVIVDLTIPGGMGGLEIKEHILAMDREAKIIVSSGYSTDPIMAEYKKYGFSGCIEKPYLRDKMQKEVSRFIKG